MKNKFFTAFLITLLLTGFNAGNSVVKSKSDKVTICHASGLAGTLHYNTLNISENAVYGPGGHFNNNGTTQAGHEQDYMGPCIEDTDPKDTDPIDDPQCIIDGLHGFLNYTGNHISLLPVNGQVWNLTENACSDTAYLHVFGSMHLFPEGDGWLESQLHVTTISLTVPQGNAKNDISEMFDNSQYCWYQVDLSPTSVILIPPYYNGANMIDYVFVKGTNPECEKSNGDDTGGDKDPELTPTPTPSPSPTTAPTQGGITSGVSTESKDEEPKILGVTTLADTGSVADYYLMLGLVLTITSLYGFKKIEN